MSDKFVTLLDHVQSRYHLGHRVDYRLHATLTSKSCGDRVSLCVRLECDLVTEVWHVAGGCVICQAAASYLCQWAEQRSIDSILRMPEEQFVNSLGPLTPMRKQCAALSLKCLKKILIEHRAACATDAGC